MIIFVDLLKDTNMEEDIDKKSELFLEKSKT